MDSTVALAVGVLRGKNTFQKKASKFDSIFNVVEPYLAFRIQQKIYFLSEKFNLVVNFFSLKKQKDFENYFPVERKRISIVNSEIQEESNYKLQDNIMNNTTESGDNFLYFESEASKVLKITAYSVVLFLSFIGNSIIIAIIYKNANHRMRTASNLFILNMAVSNLLFTVWNVPFSLKALVNDHEWKIGGNFGLFVCKFCVFSWFFSELVSTGSLSGIAMDRFILVYYPTKNLVTKKISALSITLSWIIATAFSSPLFVYTKTLQYKNKLYCFMNLGSEGVFETFTIVTFTLFIATPLLTVTVLYFAIMVKLLGQKPVGENVNNQRLERKRKENYRICLMLLTLVFLFALCVLPYWTIYLYCFVNSKNSSVCSRRHFEITFLLTFLNAAANPYIYILCSQTFLNGAKNLLLKVPIHPEMTSIGHHTRRTNHRVSEKTVVRTDL